MKTTLRNQSCYQPDNENHAKESKAVISLIMKNQRLRIESRYQSDNENHAKESKSCYQPDNEKPRLGI
jgi:hypothetical protein